MKRHTKIYMDFFGYDENSFIECERCHSRAVDVHHINALGNIVNMMYICKYEMETDFKL